MRLVSAFFSLMTAISTVHAEGRDPVPGRPYSQQELAVLATKGVAVLREKDGFFVDSGYVFHFTGTNQPTYVKNSRKVTSLLLYKGKLVALSRVGMGEVYILFEDQRPGTGWYQIGRKVKKIATDGNDLYLLTTAFASYEKFVWVFQGEAGNVRWSLTPIETARYCGNSICYSTVNVPTLAKRKVAFEQLVVQDAADLIMIDGKVAAVTRTGERVVLTK